MAELVHWGRCEHVCVVIGGRSVCNPFPLLSSRYRPTLAVSFISAELGFASDEECLSFLVDVGAVLDRESTKLDCKLTSSKLSSSG